MEVVSKVVKQRSQMDVRALKLPSTTSDVVKLQYSDECQQTCWRIEIVQARLIWAFWLITDQDKLWLEVFSF